MMFDHYEDEVENFLGATFHLDIDGRHEAALSEFVSRVNRDTLFDITLAITRFLDDEKSLEEKNAFIVENADGIYFPDLSMQPIEWLRNVRVLIELAIQTGNE